VTELLYEDLTFVIIGAAMEVYKILGPGYLEVVYQAALVHELALRGISFEQLQRLPVRYKGVLVGEYVADLVVAEKLIVELKAVSALNTSHEAQTLNYLAATGMRLALLLNFGAKSLQHKRLVK